MNDMNKQNKRTAPNVKEVGCKSMLCAFCDKPITSGAYSTDEDGESMHFDCMVEEGDNVGFDGWVQDHG